MHNQSTYISRSTRAVYRQSIVLFITFKIDTASSNPHLAMNFTGAQISTLIGGDQNNSYYQSVTLNTHNHNPHAPTMGEQSNSQNRAPEPNPVVRDCEAGRPVLGTNSTSSEVAPNGAPPYNHTTNPPTNSNCRLPPNVAGLLPPNPKHNHTNDMPRSAIAQATGNCTSPNVLTFPVIENFDSAKMTADFAKKHFSLQQVLHPLNEIHDPTQTNIDQLASDLNDFIKELKGRAKQLAKAEIAKSFDSEEFTFGNHRIDSFDTVKSFLKSRAMRLAYEEDYMIPIAIVVKTVFPTWTTHRQERWLDQEIVKWAENKYRFTFQCLHKNDKKKKSGVFNKRTKHPLLIIAGQASKTVYESILDLLETNYGLTVRRQNRPSKDHILIALKNVFPPSINIGNGSLFLLINPKQHPSVGEKEWNGKEVDSLDDLPIVSKKVNLYAYMMVLEARKRNLQVDECMQLCQRYYNTGLVNSQVFKETYAASSKEAEKLKQDFGSKVINNNKPDRVCYSTGAHSNQQHHGYVPSQNQQPCHQPTHPPPGRFVPSQNQQPCHQPRTYIPPGVYNEQPYYHPAQPQANIAYQQPLTGLSQDVNGFYHNYQQQVVGTPSDLDGFDLDPGQDMDWGDADQIDKNINEFQSQGVVEPNPPPPNETLEQQAAVELNQQPPTDDYILKNIMSQREGVTVPPTTTKEIAAKSPILSPTAKKTEEESAANSTQNDKVSLLLVFHNHICLRLHNALLCVMDI